LWLPEAQREKARKNDEDIPFNNMPAVTYLLQVGPTSYTFHHLPIVHRVMKP
jgi:hypothetical protein